MPPTSKLRGHIGLGLSVHGCLCPLCFACIQECLEIGSWNLVHGIGVKNKWTHIFYLFVGLVIAELCPFFDSCIVNYGTLWTKYLENCLSKDRDIWHTDCVQDVDMINFWKNSVIIWLNYLHFPYLVYGIIMQPCEQNNWRTAWSWYEAYSLGTWYSWLTWLTFYKILWTFDWIFMPRHQKVAGYYVIPSEILSVCPSVRLSVCLSVRPSVGQRPPPFLYRQLLLQF